MTTVLERRHNRAWHHLEINRVAVCRICIQPLFFGASLYRTDSITFALLTLARDEDLIELENLRARLLQRSRGEETAVDVPYLGLCCRCSTVATSRRSYGHRADKSPLSSLLSFADETDHEQLAAIAERLRSRLIPSHHGA